MEFVFTFHAAGLAMAAFRRVCKRWNAPYDKTASEVVADSVKGSQRA